MAWYKKITVELPLLLSFTSFLLVGSLLNNFIIYRTCYVLLDYDEADCALLGRVSNNFTKELERKVQPTANVVTMALEMPLAIVPVLVCIFAGPWSDKHGRIPIQILNLTGFTLSMFLFGIMAYFKHLSPWYFMIASIPTIVTGSSATYFVAVLSYLNDISTDYTRAVRMAVFEAVLLIGLLAGTLSSSYILYATNYETVYFIATGLLALSTLYTYFFLPETVKVKEGQESSLKELIRCSFISDMVKVIFKARENYNRCIVIILVATLTITNFIQNGENVVKFPFLREKLGWTLVKNNYFTCASHIITIIGTVGGTLLLNKKLGWSETAISLIGLICAVGNSFLKGLATNDYFIFVGSVVAVLSAAPPPLLRTRLGQIVPPEEMGKVFSLIIALGGVVGLAASYIYTMIYNATIDIHSGIFNFLSGILYLFAIFLVGVVIIFEMCSPKKKYTLEEKDTTKNDSLETNKKYLEILT